VNGNLTVADILWGGLAVLLVTGIIMFTDKGKEAGTWRYMWSLSSRLGRSALRRLPWTGRALTGTRTTIRRLSARARK
jgi:hypothetical protein